MAKFRKKPVVVEAWEYKVCETSDDLPPWLTDLFDRGLIYTEDTLLTIEMDPFPIYAAPGDWIVQDRGILSSVRPEIFAATYEAIED